MPRRMHETRAPDPKPGEIEGEDEADDRPSRSALKRDADLRERLGKEMTALPEEKLQRVPLPDEVKDAIREYARISARGGGRRQLQYIGRLMRDVELEPVKRALDDLREGDRAEARRFQQAERWRKRLLEEDDGLDAFAASHPDADRAQLEQLVERARYEDRSGKPPTAKRALFRALREALGEATDGDDEAGGEP